MTDTATQTTQEEVIYLRPSRGWSALNLRDLWRYRELTYFLTWRDIKVRYKQTVLGAGWAIIQPLVNMVVLSIIFGNFANMPTDGIPRPLFTYSALLPWGLFAKALSDSGRSMLSNRSMITKVYFPRLIIPLASVLGGLMDFAIQFVILLSNNGRFDLALIYHLSPSNCARRRAVALSAKCFVPRYRLYLAFPNAALVIPYPGRVFHISSSRAVALPVLIKPNGRSSGRFPLGIVGDGKCPGTNDFCIRRNIRLPAHQRYVLLPAYGA